MVKDNGQTVVVRTEGAKGASDKKELMKFRKEGAIFIPIEIKANRACYYVNGKLHSSVPSGDWRHATVKERKYFFKFNINNIEDIEHLNYDPLYKLY